MGALFITKKKINRLGLSENDITGFWKTVIPDFSSAEKISHLLNTSDEISSQNFSPATIFAVALLNDIYPHILKEYSKNSGKAVFEKCYTFIEYNIGKTKLNRLFSDYFKTFPIKNILHDSVLTIEDIDKEYLLIELITLALGLKNKASFPLFKTLSDPDKESTEILTRILTIIIPFFNSKQEIINEETNIIEFLLLPSKSFPDSIFDQLKFIKENWKNLTDNLHKNLLSGIDYFNEEKKVRVPGKGDISQYSFTKGLKDGREKFSSDKQWMSSLILIAKNTYVWMDQLSVQYKTEIKTLDQIPAEELDLIASRGFTGLWLIGLWERSKASATIKKLCGNPDALSSAYSIYDYKISDDLGGDDAFFKLKKRAAESGIKLAGDMVPNHMGIDSKWISKNPEWFVYTETPPFSSYTFNGPDLSTNGMIGIFLEDHYYERSDAAVVFKLVNNANSNVKFIYHGNDGTSMPWNDTAQLNYLKKEVRNHVIKTILEISDKFNIIRFDAAMTLTKQHFRRLWFPPPGSGGDIPSRSGHTLSDKEFNELFPEEFWSEVVDTVEQSAPDTLLMAEAFWMMEPYFVRTLGMHRVYNSAFMNFLKNENNAEFRKSIKNIIESDPRILERLVNFMNNPDEETAVIQFGKDDKYFGVCTLLSTLPGLPMFGHGQIEGFTEKYGMEFKKSYWNEKIDSNLIKRHEKEIFPLLRDRKLFSNSDNFRLYDFINSNGDVDENVIVYSNFNNGVHSLIVFNNKYSSVSGRIKTTSPFISFAPNGEKILKTENLHDALNLTNDIKRFTVFEDKVTDLKYIRSNSDIVEKGLYFEIGAFKYHVFMNFKEINDNNDKKYHLIHEYLKGKGVNDLNSVNKNISDSTKTNLFEKNKISENGNNTNLKIKE